MTIKLIGLILCGIAGGLAGYYGGWVTVLAVALGQTGIYLYTH